MMINNYHLAVKGRVRGQLTLDHVFGFCITFKRITKNLSFQITFKTANLQDIIYTSIGDNINVTISSLYLYVPFFKPSTETQIKFNESIQNIF